MKTKGFLCATCAALGGAAEFFWGPFSYDLASLTVFMAIDYIMGIIVAAVFKKSPKTKNGRLSSEACFKGIIRKAVMLMFVVTAHMLDGILGVNFIRGAVIVGFSVNELISIVENAGLMGIVSPAMENALEVLKERMGK